MGGPSFFPIIQAAKQFATKLVNIQLSPPEFDLDLNFLMGELKESCLVILDNPNDPTGKILLDRRMVKAITTGLNKTNTLLVIDESYYEFAGTTFAGMVQNCPNLAIARTMDKAFGLAGARVGYLIAGRAFLEPLSLSLSSYCAFLSQSSLCAAIQALDEPDYVRRNVQRVIEERERVWRALGQLGVQVHSSSTNFLLVKTVVPDIVSKFRDRGVLISDLSSQLSPGFVRVSIGTREENDAFISGYAEIRQAHD